MKNKKRLIIVLLVLSAFLLLSVVSVFGSDDDIYYPLKVLRDNGLDSIGNFGMDVIRSIGWGLIKGLARAVDGLYHALNGVFELLSFGTSSKIMALAMKYKVLYKALLTVTLVGVGLWLIMGNKIENQINVSTCLMLMLLIVLGMPVITEKMTDLTIATSRYAMSQWAENTSAANDKKLLDSVSSGLIYDQIVDLDTLDQSITPGSKSIPRFSKYGSTSNDFRAGSDDYKSIDINEGMGDDNNNDLKNPDIWKHKLQYKVNGDKRLNVVKTTDKFFISEYYYRYQVRSWAFLFLELLATVIVLVFTLIRVIRLIVEVAMAQIYMPLISVTDIATGQRIKEALKGFITLFASIFLIYALLGVYFLGMVFINSLNVNGTLKFIFIIGLAIALIDGSDILERVLGVDLGLKSSTWILAGAYTGTRATVGAAKAVSKGVKNLANKINGKEHAKSLNDKVNNKSNPSNKSEENTTNKNSPNHQEKQENTDKSINNNNNMNQDKGKDNRPPSSNPDRSAKTDTINSKDIQSGNNKTFGNSNSNLNDNNRVNRDSHNKPISAEKNTPRPTNKYQPKANNKMNGHTGGNNTLRESYKDKNPANLEKASRPKNVYRPKNKERGVKNEK